jgi:hypothetical protein
MVLLKLNHTFPFLSQAIMWLRFRHGKIHHAKEVKEMTSNMINYRNLEEARRHNREMERLTGEQQAEVARHNQATEAETYRTNLANEQIKAQANVINGNHYGRTDYETARHNTVTEYYTMQYPTTHGKTDAEIAKVRAEAGYTQGPKTQESLAKASESMAKAEEARSKVGLNTSTQYLNYSKSSQIAADLLLKSAQTDKVRAETNLIQTKEMYYPSESISGTIRNVTGSMSDLFRSMKFSFN